MAEGRRVEPVDDHRRNGAQPSDTFGRDQFADHIRLSSLREYDFSTGEEAWLDGSSEREIMHHWNSDQCDAATLKTRAGCEQVGIIQIVIVGARYHLRQSRTTS